jgi:hypothetical protein
MTRTGAQPHEFRVAERAESIDLVLHPDARLVEIGVTPGLAAESQAV